MLFHDVCSLRRASNTSQERLKNSLPTARNCILLLTYIYILSPNRTDTPENAVLKQSFESLRRMSFQDYFIASVMQLYY